MNPTTTTTTSEQNLVDQCQLTGFDLFKERLSHCCCRLLRKSSSYHLNEIQSQSEENISKTQNQNKQKENIQRQNKLDLIAKTLPQPKTTTKDKVVPSSTKVMETRKELSRTVVKGTRQPSSSSSSSDESTDDQSSSESSDSD